MRARRARILAVAIPFGVGSLVGAAVEHVLHRDPLLWLTVTNATSQPIASTCVLEDRFAARHCLDLPLAPGTSRPLPIVVRGEVGYRVAVRFADGRELEREFYAETGHRVEHAVSESMIDVRTTLP